MRAVGCTLKCPGHVAVIVPDLKRYQTAIVDFAHSRRISSLTIICPSEEKCVEQVLGKNIKVYFKHSYPQNMLASKNCTEQASEYDLVVCMEDQLGLYGMDARCLGFAHILHLPSPPYPLFILAQLNRALFTYGRLKQNYGK